jgi:hypothetical protein
LSEATATTEGMGPLDLSDADTSGIEPIPSGTELKAEVFQFEPTSIKNEGGKMEVGTPGFKVQARIINDGEGSQYYNRRVFNNYWLPLPSYDQEKAKKMRGMFVNFLEAIGFTKEEIMGGSFQVPSSDDIEGREFMLRVGVQPAREGYPAQNTFLSVKSLQEAATSASGLI